MLTKEILQFQSVKPSNIMWKKILGIIFILGLSTQVKAQRIAFVNSEYILSKMPEYTAAQKQLDALSEQWTKEIEALNAEIAKMYRTLEAEKPLLTEEMFKRRKLEIELKEKEVADLQNKRFGFDGDIFKKKQELIKPIQDKVYSAIQRLAREKQYDIIFDKSGDLVMLYGNAKFDKSDEVIELMGYTVKK